MQRKKKVVKKMEKRKGKGKNDYKSEKREYNELYERKKKEENER